MNTKNIRKGLSKKEIYLLSKLSMKGRNIFTVDDAMEILNYSRKTAANFVGKLVNKKAAVSLAKGKYLIVPLSAGAESNWTTNSFLIASNLVKPYYIGYWSALNYRDLTEQAPSTVFVATTKRRKDRKIQGVKYKFITLVESKFFGFTPASKNKVNISDKEKTIVDCLDHPEYCGGVVEAVKGIWNGRDDISLEKLVDYAERAGNGAVLKRLGYLLELLELQASKNLLNRLQESITKGISLLDPIGPKEGKCNTRWNLRINRSRGALLDWRKY